MRGGEGEIAVPVGLHEAVAKADVVDVEVLVDDGERGDARSGDVVARRSRRRRYPSAARGWPSQHAEAASASESTRAEHEAEIVRCTLVSTTETPVREVGAIGRACDMPP